MFCAFYHSKHITVDTLKTWYMPFLALKCKYLIKIISSTTGRPCTLLLPPNKQKMKGSMFEPFGATPKLDHDGFKVSSLKLSIN